MGPTPISRRHGVGVTATQPPLPWRCALLPFRQISQPPGFARSGSLLRAIHKTSGQGWMCHKFSRRSHASVGSGLTVSPRRPGLRGWWVGRQMRLEREHCCDDIAVAICGSAFEYASALAEMEQIRGRIPAPALAAAGGELQPPNCIQREPGDTTIAPGKTGWDYCGLIGFTGRGRLQASSTTMAELANFLSFPLRRTVGDKTGITGEFRIQLTYTPDASTVPFANAAGPSPADASAAADLGPDIFTALQEQLGLKVESAKGPVEVLVIDHVERPSEN
jgi:hypothetical protein